MDKHIIRLKSLFESNPRYTKIYALWSLVFISGFIFFQNLNICDILSPGTTCYLGKICLNLFYFSTAIFISKSTDQEKVPNMIYYFVTAFGLVMLLESVNYFQDLCYKLFASSQCYISEMAGAVIVVIGVMAYVFEWLGEKDQEKKSE